VTRLGYILVPVFLTMNRCLRGQGCSLNRPSMPNWTHGSSTVDTASTLGHTDDHYTGHGPQGTRNARGLGHHFAHRHTWLIASKDLWK